MRTESLSGRRGVAALAAGWVPPVTTTDGSRTVDVVPHAAASIATARTAATTSRRGPGFGRTAVRTLVGSPGADRRSARSAGRALRLGEPARAPLAALAERENARRDERERGHPDRPPEGVAERGRERVRDAGAHVVGHALQDAAAAARCTRAPQLHTDLVLEDDGEQRGADRAADALQDVQRAR